MGTNRVITEGDIVYGDVTELQDWVNRHVDAGVVCPVCEVASRRYRIRMNKSYVRALTIMARLGVERGDSSGWFKVGQKELGKTLAHDLNHLKYSKLAYWGLVEKMTEGHNRKKFSGFWRVTDSGKAFLEGKQKVASYVKEFRGKADYLSSDLITVDEATGVHFDFDFEVLGKTKEVS